MEPVLGFVPDSGLRAVDDGGGDLFAAMRGQAMKEDRVGRRSFHRGIVDDEAYLEYQQKNA